ncbi:MAG: phage/plasmid primase, P4 family [Chloroflexota bacterium]|nr:phage/plasmid primase, P4 family [Chloroflexota bacterium]
MTATTKPAALTVDPGNIPAELRSRRQWVSWTNEHRDGKSTKVPLMAATGTRASSTDSRTWAGFDDALAAADRDDLPGVGYVFAEDDPFTGVDLDGCRDPLTERIEPWAAEIIEALNSYTELSPSGTGVHIIVRAVKPAGRNRRGPIELYDQKRFFTMTGNRLPGTPGTIEHRQDALGAFYQRMFGPEPAPRSTPVGGASRLTDDEVLEKLRTAKNNDKFLRLWAGDTGGSGSASEADAALCSQLMFYTDDPGQIDRLFRRSGLMRPKWDERHYGDGRTYGQGTIGFALGKRTETWTPPGTTPIRPGRNGADPAADRGPEPASDHEQRGGHDETGAPLTIHQTDLGNARRLIRQHGPDLRYCATWGKWLVWDGRRWPIDASGAVSRRAKQTIGSMYQEAAALPDEAERKALAKHAIRSEAAARIEAMIGLAATEPGIPVRPDDLDTDPWLLNVENGVLDLRIGALLPHNRRRLITKLVPAPFDPLAECPTWDAFLTKILAGKADLIGFVQRAIGYSLSGRVTERLLFLLYGLGRNGKSTLLDTVLELMGDYAVRTTSETVLATRDGGIPNDVARLKGMRFVYASELEENRRLAESKVKDLTGGDTISARFMRGEWFDFRPEFKLWLATNHKPVIRGSDEAIWDRIRLIPFNVRISDDDLDRDLKDKLLAERAGILRWAVEGCLAWQRQGLGTPVEVIDATSDYRRESDLVGQFLDDECVVAKSKRATAKELYSAYVSWCGGVGEKPITQKAFGQRLSDRGFGSTRVGRSRATYWNGVYLRPRPRGFSDQAA